MVGGKPIQYQQSDVRRYANPGQADDFTHFHTGQSYAHLSVGRSILCAHLLPAHYHVVYNMHT
jgi:hypothetical protein